MKRIAVVLGGFALFLAVAMPAHADDVFSQAPDNAFKWLSQTASGANGAHTVYDNFTLTSAAGITDVEWTGLLNPSFGVIDGFTINFYADSGSNTPGSLLATNIIVGDANEAPTGENDGGYAVINFNSPITLFSAAANTEYWISIVADAPTIQYGWSNSPGGDANMFQDNGNVDGDSNPVLDQIGSDAAFTLSTPVPEPSSVALLGTGALTFAGVARRRIFKR